MYGRCLYVRVIYTCICTSPGHRTAVKSLSVSDNETVFVSASKDKTVKVWSLRNHGDGHAALGSRLTYLGHQKPVFATDLLGGSANALSCDGTLHVRNTCYVVTSTPSDRGCC